MIELGIIYDFVYKHTYNKKFIIAINFQNATN